MLKKQSGVTLTEMLTVLAILAILILVSGMALMKYLPRAHMKHAARSIAGLCHKARAWSLQKCSHTAVVFDAASNTITFYSNDTDGDWNTASDNTLVTQFKLSTAGNELSFGHGSAAFNIDGSNTWTANNIPIDGYLEFSAHGTLVSSADSDTKNTVYLQNPGGNCFAVTARPSGGITIMEWTGSKWN